jgi:hypothetical protein
MTRGCFYPFACTATATSTSSTLHGVYRDSLNEAQATAVARSGAKPLAVARVLLGTVTARGSGGEPADYKDSFLPHKKRSI